MKCLKKAYSLNPTDEPICLAYVDSLIAQEDQVFVIVILHSFFLSNLSKSHSLTFTM